MAFGKSAPSSNKTIFLCCHCGDQFTSNVGLCSKCKTPEKRAALDELNRKIFADSKMEYHCEYCSREKIQAKQHEEYMKK